MTIRSTQLSRLLFGVLLLILAAPWAAWITIDWTEQQAYKRLKAQGRDRLTLYGVAMRSELEKSRNIPVVLSSDHEVKALLAVPAVAERPNDRMLALDRRLETLRLSLGVAAVYMLDRDGIVLASSNWNQGARSYVGRHLSFRPYYISAMQGREGRYFAIGSTVNEPGYYIAMPVWESGKVVGAVAVKTSMGELERGWSGGGERVFVTDRNGVIFITNTPEWRYRSLTSLDAEALQELKSSRQYGNETVLPLGLRSGAVLTSVDNNDYVMVSQSLPDHDGWTLHVLIGVKEAQANARDRGLLAVAVMGLSLLGMTFVAYRILMVRRYTNELERRVKDRTVALVASNNQLQDEIVERKRAEDELTSKQAELVQAAKLAALGRMSASMAHEINQPLSAIRAFADNSVALLDMGHTTTARNNLSEIAELTERMARITGQLKQFARKSSGRFQMVSVTAATEGALALMMCSMRDEDVIVNWQRPVPDLKVSVDELQLQQVIVNLLTNALDALRNVTERRVSISVEVDASRVSIVVRDNGPGIASDAMAQMFEPFFTTKPAGEGLGLGLSISEGIVRELGGALVAANHPEGGAVFTVVLPRTESA